MKLLHFPQQQNIGEFLQAVGEAVEAGGYGSPTSAIVLIETSDGLRFIGCGETGDGIRVVGIFKMAAHMVMAEMVDG